MSTSSLCLLITKLGGYINITHLLKYYFRVLGEILTRFSIDFFTRLKLFQRESNSCLWDPWNCKRSPIICVKKFQNFIFLSHCIKPVLLIIMKLLDDNCTFMIRNKDLVSSSELLSMWSITGEEIGFWLK